MKDSEDLLNALKEGRTPGAKNLAVDYMRTDRPKSFNAVLKTKGPSLATLSSGKPTMWIRKNGNRTILVEYKDGKTISNEKGTVSAPVWVTEMRRIP